MKICIARCQNGRPCAWPCLSDSDYCRTHDPRPWIVERRRQTRSRGGKMRRKYLPKTHEGIPLESVEDIGKLGLRLTRELQGGRLDIRSANALYFGCSVVLRAADLAAQEDPRIRHAGLIHSNYEITALSELVQGGQRMGVSLDALALIHRLASAAAKHRGKAPDWG